MSDIWRNCVNKNAGTERIESIDNYVSEVDEQIISPIDGFYKASEDMIRVVSPAFLREHPSMGALIFIGFVSTTENYFRDVFSKIIQVCPVAKKNSSDKSINLGSVVWHGALNVERGVFENQSFASKENILKISKNFINIKLDDYINVKTILEEFEKICELRHGIVHSNSYIAGKNAVKLGISSIEDKDLKVEIDFDKIHECAAVCHTLVSEVNNVLFEVMTKRWAIDWREYPTYHTYEYDRLYKEVWRLFYSEIDNSRGDIQNSISWVKCRNRVKKEFNV